MNCSFCQGETPGFTEQSGGRAFCDATCQTGFYDQIGIVVYNTVTEKWMPRDLIIKQLTKLSFKDLIEEYKAIPALKEILDSQEFEIQWLHSFSQVLTKEDKDNGKIFCNMMDYSYEKKFRIGFILFDLPMFDDFILTDKLIEYALQFKVFKSRRLSDYGDWAIKNNKIETFKMLLTSGMTDHVTNYTNSLMTLAVQNKRLEFLRLMLILPPERGFDPSHENDFLIHYTAQNNDIEAVKLLLKDKRVNPVSDANFAIRISCQLGFTEIVRLLLLDPRVDPTVRDNVCIQVSAQNGHLDVVNLLLVDNRADPSANHNRAIRVASEKGYIEIVKLLLSDPRVDPTVNNNHSIRIAAQNGHLETVKLLLSDPRVDPTARDNYAIEFASEDGHLEVVQLLLNDSRVDPTADDNYAVRLAATNNHLSIVKLLLSVENLYNAKMHLQLMIIAREKNNKELADLVQGFARRMNEGDRKKTKILNKI